MDFYNRKVRRITSIIIILLVIIMVATSVIPYLL